MTPRNRIWTGFLYAIGFWLFSSLWLVALAFVGFVLAVLGLGGMITAGMP